MNYTLIMQTGNRYKITEEEKEFILNTKELFVELLSGTVIRRTAISEIRSSEDAKLFPSYKIIKKA